MKEGESRWLSLNENKLVEPVNTFSPGRGSSGLATGLGARTSAAARHSVFVSDLQRPELSLDHFSPGVANAPPLEFSRADSFGSSRSGKDGARMLLLPSALFVRHPGSSR